MSWMFTEATRAAQVETHVRDAVPAVLDQYKHSPAPNNLTNPVVEIPVRLQP